jgi:hypothetical protein
MGVGVGVAGVCVGAGVGVAVAVVAGPPLSRKEQSCVSFPFAS